MSSINTNFAAMTALQSLSQTQSELTTTQNRISTGQRVSEASDNAAYWSIATTMRSDVKSLSAVQDALGLGASQIGVAYTATNSAIDVVDQIKAKLVAAKQPGIDRKQLQTEITSLQSQLTNISDSASFSGDNWLSVELECLDLHSHQGHRRIVHSLSGRRHRPDDRGRYDGEGTLQRRCGGDQLERRHHRRKEGGGREHRRIRGNLLHRDARYLGAD